MPKQAGKEKYAGALRDSSGQALVEAAMMTLLLFVFVFAIFEAGRLLQVQQTLTDAAREGARRAVAPMTQTLPGDLPNINDIKGLVQSYGAAGSLSILPNMINVECVGPAPTYATHSLPCISTDMYTRVTVTYPYKVMTLLMFGKLNMTLTGQSLMRNETSQ